MTKDQMKSVQRAAYPLIGLSESKEDLASEGYLGWVNAEKKNPGQKEGYYAIAAKRKMIDYVRKQNGRYEFSTGYLSATFSLDHLVEKLLHTSHNVAGNMGYESLSIESLKVYPKDEVFTHISMYIEQLSPIDKAIIHLHYYMGWKDREIAELCGIKTDEIYKRRSIILKSFKSKHTFDAYKPRKNKIMFTAASSQATLHHQLRDIIEDMLLSCTEEKKYNYVKKEFEKVLFGYALEKHNNVEAKTAKYLGISRNTLRDRIKQFSKE